MGFGRFCYSEAMAEDELVVFTSSPNCKVPEGSDRKGGQGFRSNGMKFGPKYSKAGQWSD